jgi:hypothetical protein
MVQDNDNAKPPTALREVNGKQGRREFMIGKNNSYTIVVKPKLASQVYDTTLSSAYVQTEANQWVDSANPTADYYALKLWIQNCYLPAGATTNTAIRFDFDYNVCFRGAQNLD